MVLQRGKPAGIHVIQLGFLCWYLPASTKINAKWNTIGEKRGELVTASAESGRCAWETLGPNLKSFLWRCVRGL
jgi:hypothetical protein